MPRPSPGQRKTTGRVMHEFAHGELKSGKDGKGGKVKSRKQAIAIALSESGESNYASKRKNKSSLAKTKRKEATGKTAQQEKEGRRHIGADDQRESSRAMGGRNATRTTAAGNRAAHSRARDGGPTKTELYKRAQKRGIANRSKMSKRQLENAWVRRSGR